MMLKKLHGPVRKILCLSLLLLASCSSGNEPGDQPHSSKGVLTERFVCDSIHCCGQWGITIDGTPYRFTDLPAGSALNGEHVVFPMSVRLDWQKVENGCTENLIIVEAIEKE